MLSGNLGYDPTFTVTTMTMRTAKLKSTPAVTHGCGNHSAIDMERTLTQLPFWSSLTEQGKRCAEVPLSVIMKGRVHTQQRYRMPWECCSSFRRDPHLSSPEEGRDNAVPPVSGPTFCVLSASCVISQITFGYANDRRIGYGRSDYPCKCHCGAQGAKSSCPLLPL